MVAQAVMSIFKNLGLKSVNFLDSILPTMLLVIRYFTMVGCCSRCVRFVAIMPVFCFGVFSVLLCWLMIRFVFLSAVA